MGSGGKEEKSPFSYEVCPSMVTRWREILRGNDPVGASKDRISCNNHEQISWSRIIVPLKNGNVSNVRILSQATNMNGESSQFPKNQWRFSFYSYYGAGKICGLQTAFPRPEAERPASKGFRFGIGKYFGTWVVSRIKLHPHPYRSI